MMVSLQQALRVGCSAVLFAILLAFPSQAQQDEELPTVTRTYAIENAHVVQAPGQAIEQATVVVRDGLIHAVGQDAEIPYDAQRIEGDSLVVYAGFIDGLSHAGVDTPSSDEDDDVEDPGNPPYEHAGIQPDRQAHDILDPGDNDLENLREVGFTTAHVVPSGRMLPGTGALIQLAGSNPGEMTLRENASLFAQLEGAQGVYPATDMGVIARLRELYREAERRREIGAAYEEDPSGRERLPSDPVHTALFPVIEGTQPVFFRAEEALDIHRALDLRSELGFSLALVGLEEAFDAMEALQEAEGLPLFLTLDLPEETEEAEADTAEADTARAVTPERPGSFFRSDLRVRSYADLETEKRNLEARQALVRQEYYRTASLLHDAGLRFGFTTLDASPREIHDNLRTMIEHGLPEDAALAALTTDAAVLLGLDDRLGTVEEGKIANLVVTSGSLFDENSEVRYVFVDGQPFKYDAAPSGDPDAEGEADPAGTWSYEVSTPDGDISGTLTITGTPGDLSGTITSEISSETTELEDVQLEGNELTFDFEGPQDSQISASLTIRGDEIEGTFSSSEFGELPVTGTRTSGPDGGM